jgi:AcrR family transcriptional regulator
MASMASPPVVRRPEARRPGARREQILDAAAELFARRGFRGTSIEDIGAAVGISGPALYRHFPSKEMVLAEMLVNISEELLQEGARRVLAAAGPHAALDALLCWHVEFALSKPALITVHDRELGNVPEPARRRVRRLQRLYAEEWLKVLGELFPRTPRARLRAATHAAFGLLNSTPHSASELDKADMAQLLHAMARAALTGPPAVPPPPG